ncbi:hypothetical protein HH1059_06360 [Halorhodospira halochloris]|uniref:Uncharacterized protein n=1 Tax=Halorhodospira halochloris TaxID=1052 RepID=A0A2Z6EZQ4_HALHR|nr:hypothetical protein [Halorhodospira halochloris]MBK1652845.1 hypothetical protein [Halorhodospira halochloris]BBE11004.1 hypothetical protein HH1059_06360 [Halorhodospira halochloris]
MSDNVNDKGGTRSTAGAGQEDKTTGGPATETGSKEQGSPAGSSKASQAKPAGGATKGSSASSAASKADSNATAGGSAAQEENKATTGQTADTSSGGSTTASSQGQGQSSAASSSTSGAKASPSAGPSTNPEQVENTATVASYIVGAVTGLMYLLAHRDKPRVRFHASRSILITVVIVAAWLVVSLLKTTVAGIPLVLWAGFAFLIYMAVLAFKGTTLEIPFLDDYVKKFSEKMSPK